jgi:hypothetical protein
LDFRKDAIDQANIIQHGTVTDIDGGIGFLCPPLGNYDSLNEMTWNTEKKGKKWRGEKNRGIRKLFQKRWAVSFLTARLTLTLTRFKHIKSWHYYQIYAPKNFNYFDMGGVRYVLFCTTSNFYQIRFRQARPCQLPIQYTVF